MIGIVDRLEGQFAVIETENGTFINRSVDFFKQVLREGDKVDLNTGDVLATGFDNHDISAYQHLFKK